jgi:hypothetical protein
VGSQVELWDGWKGSIGAQKLATTSSARRARAHVAGAGWTDKDTGCWNDERGCPNLVALWLGGISLLYSGIVLL